MELPTTIDVMAVIIGMVAAIIIGGLLLSFSVHVFVTIADKIAAKHREKKYLRQRIEWHAGEEKKKIASLLQQAQAYNSAIEELRRRTSMLEDDVRSLSIAYNMYQRSMTFERAERKKNMDNVNTQEKLYQYNVKFNVFDPDQKNLKEYFYFAFKEYGVGEVVVVDTANGLSLARVSSIAPTIPNIPVERIRTIVGAIDYDAWRDKLEAFSGNK